MDPSPTRTRTASLTEFVNQKLVGQPAAVERIVPYIQMHQAELSPEGRPIAVFLLLGPTGTGKTRTVEVLAEALHGSQQRYLRVDCGEFQHDHEVAKLIGSPPGYLGHRETVPVLSKQKLAEMVTPKCDISLVLFDEIEKAAPSLASLLLGVLDKGRLTLGDNSTVNFDHSLVFFTSNLGAREMMREMNPSFGFEAGSVKEATTEEIAGKLEAVALSSVRKRFSPEFVNRIDAVITYQPLRADAIEQILNAQIQDLQDHINRRLGQRSFRIEVTPAARTFMLGKGVSTEYGARELKRVVYRYLTQPLATMVAEDRIMPGSAVTAVVDETGTGLRLETGARVPVLIASPMVLIVDDNDELLKLLTTVMAGEKWETFVATTAEQALEIAGKQQVDVALVDYMLPDGDGLALSKTLMKISPEIEIILMTGGEVSFASEMSSLPQSTPVIQKPFLVYDVLTLIRNRVATSRHRASAATT